jgi:ubiquinone/menaquinone biosynthesis methyltransferase
MALPADSANPDVNAAAFAPKADDVFARIATRYDLLCDIFSLFIHRRWKARMARLIAEQPAETMLDAASGTGHIAQRVLGRLRAKPGTSPLKKLLATDLCPEMLAVAKTKRHMDDPRIEFALHDAHDMKQIADNSVDLFSIAFAMKICDRKRVVAEAMRVLKPGGQFFCLEASRIPAKGVQSLYLRYMDWCLPVMGWIATGGDRSAYNYLLRGIHGFPAAPDFAQELRETGFDEVSYQNLTFGIVALHRARKPTA